LPATHLLIFVLYTSVVQQQARGLHVAGGQNFYGPRAFSIDCCVDAAVGNFN